MPENPLTLLLVHAHPDDEAITTGGIMLKYATEGIRTVLVTCTKGELGDIQDPDTYVPPEPGMTMEDIRMEELTRALEILKVSAFHCLAYRDSGMAGTPGNKDPRAFAMADLDEASDKLATIMRKERPQVVVTYDETGIYHHPDHVMAHKITQKAFFDTVDPGTRVNGAPNPWQPAKLYHIAIPMARVKRYRAEEGQAQANQRPSTIVGTPEEEITTRIDITQYLDLKFEALFAHKSQIGTSHRFRNMAPEQRTQMFGFEHFVCAQGCAPLIGEEKEADLFYGIKTGPS